jgi:hypothetical protein
MWSRDVLPSLSLAVLLTLSASAATAQQWQTRCEGHERRDDRGRHCLVKDLTLSPTGSLEVDAGPNGGVQVSGWDRNHIAVRVVVVGRAKTGERAQALASEVRIEADRGSIRAKGPSTGRNENWSASYEIYVPRSQNLDLETKNGGIEVNDVRGKMGLATVNGGVHLSNLGGDVQARTTNGGLHIELSGSRWEGAGLDAQTKNGGVSLTMPEGYSARLETGTTNGGLEIDFPVMVQGRVTRRLSVTLGDGGPLIRAMTTNGGVHIERR